MSVPFNKTINARNGQVIQVNISGVNSDYTIDNSQFKFEIFAYDRNTAQVIFTASLSLEEVKELYSYLNNISLIKDGASKTQKFIEITPDLASIIPKVQNIDIETLKLVLTKVKTNEKIKAILESLSEIELNNLSAVVKQTTHKASIEKLKKLLDFEKKGLSITDEVKKDESLSRYSAGQPEKIFQRWTEENHWVLGTEYIKRHDPTKIGINSEADLVLETADGFIDLTELKRSIPIIFKFDESHKCYYPTPELSEVLGQSLHYLKTLEEYKYQLEKIYKAKVLKPRVLIIIGRSFNFCESEYETLRMLNSNLNHIKIYTYDYLIKTGERIIAYYEAEEKEQ